MRRCVGLLKGKDIRHSTHAQASMLKGIARLATAVGATLGPRGRNVIIQQPFGAPKITKDGVTVAKSIDLKDPFENLGAQLLRQVADTTNNVAGDGTTTATILAHGIFQEGHKCVSSGANPMDLKRGIDVAVREVCARLETIKRSTETENDIAQVATISANGDIEVGTLIATAFSKVGKDGVITTQDGKTLDNELEIVEGMSMDRGFMSPYLVTSQKTNKVEYEEAKVLIFSKKIPSAMPLMNVLNHCAGTGLPLLIIAEDIDNDALTALIYNKMQGRLKVTAAKAPGFGDNRTNILHDIAVFTGATLVTEEAGLKMEDVTEAHLGSVKKLTQTKDDTIMLDGQGSKESIQERVELLKEHINAATSEYDRDKMKERLAKLSGGVAVIKVGGASDVEVGEKKDRVTDSLNATRAAISEGIVPGGGTALLWASKGLDEIKNEKMNHDQALGVDIIQRACKMPCRTIATNAGEEGSVVVQTISSQDDPAVGFDAQELQYGDMFAKGIIDPTRVVRTALVDAASVSGLLMTTDVAICDLPEENPPPPAGGGMGGMGGMDGMF